MTKLKSFWGCVPLAFFFLCIAFVAVVQTVTGDTLRTVPQNILICFGTGSFGILMLWGNMRFDLQRKGTGQRIFCMLSMLIKMLSVFAFALLSFFSIFIMGFSYKPEHIVTKNGIKMIARATSFSDEQVYYYQYRNIFFYGKQLGYEYYGSGSRDPLAQTPLSEPVQWIFYDLDGNVIDSGSGDRSNDNGNTEQEDWTGVLEEKAEIKQLSVDVIEGQDGKYRFSISPEDFIDSYNGYYWRNHGVRYLSPVAGWKQTKSEGCLYEFKEDENKWSLPTIQLYTSESDNKVQKIMLNFDDHSYTEELYNKYEEMCFYTLKVLFSEMNEERIKELYKTLNHLAYANFTEVKYDDMKLPYVMYYKNGIGLYPYFAAGECVHLCIVPVTQQYLDELSANGVEIHDIEREFEIQE